MKKIALFFTILLFVGISASNAQTKLITGKVTSAEDSEPIPGVSIIVKGTTLGTITNLDGEYTLRVPDDAESLVFSFVGMKSVEVPITGTIVSAELSSDVIGVDEVMVVAYGTVKKESFTGSASTVDGDKLEKMQTSSITKALQGISSGVQVTSGSGQPGANATIRIRGISTFGDADPLIVVDGFPFDGNINSIAAENIASMTVLKDASATALYGSRAANGVIMITTKQGRQGTANLEIKASYGFSERAIPEYDRVNIPQYYELQWEGIRNALIAQGTPAGEAANTASQDLISTLGGYNVYNVPDDQVVDGSGNINSNGQLLWTDDWQDELFDVGQRKEITISASGGSEKTDYYLSGAILDDDGIIKASNFKRYSVRANVNSQLNDWVKVGMNLSGSLSQQNFPNSSGTAYANSFFYTRMVAPIYPVYLYDLEGNQQFDAEGNLIYDYGNEYGRSRAFSSNSNPLGTIMLDTREYNRDIVTLRSYVEFTLAEGLTFRPSFSTDYYTYSGLTHQNQKFGDADSFGGRSTRTTNRTLSYTANQLFYYDNDFGDHHINALAGHENYSYKYNNLTATRTGFPFPGLVELDAAATAEGSGSYEDNYRIESYLAKLDYDYMDRYYFSFNIRTDGNSRFHEDARWGQFWGVGASWRLSEENFLQDQTWLNTLRVKASYGEQGSDRIGTLYAYQGLYATGWNNIDFPGLLADRLPTPELTWEALESTNFGADIKFLDRFTINFEYYIRNNNDLLFEQPLPPSTGFTSIDANIARLSNVGYEVEANALLVNSANFTWDLSFNLSHYTNEIKELPQDFIVSGSKRWEVGKSIYDFWIREYAGVNRETGKSQWYYDIIEEDAEGNLQYDEDGDPILTGERDVTEEYSDADRYYVGSAIPDFTGGVTNSFQIFNFDLFVFLNYGIGGKVLDGSYQSLMHAGEYGDHWHTDVLNRWTPDNTDTDVPIIDGDQNANGRSTRFLTDASYLNVRSVNLGYSFPESLISKINLSSLRLFVAGDNLKLFTKREGLDPLQSLSGTPGNQYTPIRTISFGLDVKF